MNQEPTIRDRWLGATCYLSFFVLVPMLMRNRTEFVAEHCRQGFTVLFAEIVVGLLVWVLERAFGMVPVLGVLVSMILNIAYFLLCVSITKKLTATEVVNILTSILESYSHQAPPFSEQILGPQESSVFREFMVVYFVEMFSYYQISLTKFVYYNIYTHNVFEEKICPILSLDQGEVQDAQKYLLLFE